MNSIAHLDTKVLDMASKFFRVMIKAGADFTGPLQNVWQRKNLVHYLNIGCPNVDNKGTILIHEFPQGEELCRLILGDDFILPEELENTFNFSYENHSKLHFKKTLPNLETLIWLRANNYMLLPGPDSSLNIMDLRKLDPELFASDVADDWYTAKRHDIWSSFASDGMWLIIRKNPKLKSNQIFWNDRQKFLLEEQETVPNVAQVVYALIVALRVRKVRLLDKTDALTSDIDQMDAQRGTAMRITVGWTKNKTIQIYTCNDQFTHSDVGILTCLEGNWDIQ